MTDHEKALLEAYERGYAKGAADEAARHPAYQNIPFTFPPLTDMTGPTPPPVEPGMARHTVTCGGTHP